MSRTISPCKVPDGPAHEHAARLTFRVLNSQNDSLGQCVDVFRSIITRNYGHEYSCWRTDDVSDSWCALQKQIDFF